MKVAITGFNKVTSKKDGQGYEIYNGISDTGEAVQIFLNEDQAKEYKIPSSVVPSKEDLERAFEVLPVVEAEFNNKGRLTGLTL